MSASRLFWLPALAGLCALASAQAQTYGLGQALTAQAIAPWDIDVAADGAGLPRGRGSVAAGKLVYDAQCAACHGAKGEGGIADRLAGGKGSLATTKPVRTVGSYWPYATTLYDFINRAMPYTAPKTLKPEEVYAVTAYVLHLNDIVAADAVLDAKGLAAVRMPNRDGFVADARPDTGPTARRP
ncbi:c-type cytochrome [Xylophilus rhododendri]|uniref:C-type cytochrome n=1 Tax=Xylophilus rhododendri TaxID=2697032 RepID=A0A857J7F1_9BURK|nr:cytochrome c [Xylophilus rhododendri]QHI99904.1 c-type cytochrome [Xylophilus rhododendri]